MKTLPTRETHGNWVQTERAAHEAWAALIRKSGLAAQIMHVLASRVGDHNAVVISHGVLANLVQASRQGVQKALAILNSDRWIEIRQIGDRGTVNAYVLNDRAVWSGPRDGIRYSLFSAAVVVSSDEQPDATELDRNNQLRPLRRLPTMHPGEQQLPSGDGLPPPSQPSIPGMEPDLPARGVRPPTPSAQLDLEDDAIGHRVAPANEDKVARAARLAAEERARAK